MIPPDAPEALVGKGLAVGCFVDAGFMGCEATRRSHRYRSDHIRNFNNAPIVWISKRQATVETFDCWIRDCGNKDCLQLS